MTSIGSTKISSVDGAGAVAFGSSIALSASNTNPQETVVFSIEVPEGKTWRLKYASVCCFGWGKWRLKVDDIICAGGATNPAHPTDRNDFPDCLDIPPGSVINLIYLYSNGPNNMPVDGYMGFLEY